MKSTTDGHAKSWRERLAAYPHLPNVKPIPERMQERFGCGTIVTPSPREVDEAMRGVPRVASPPCWASAIISLGNMEQPSAAQ